MNKKILMISMALFAVAMLVAPVLAKGPPPENVEGKNPNAVVDTATLIIDVPFPPYELTVYLDVLDLNLPSEVTNRWFAGTVHIVVKSAEKFYNPTDIVFDDPNTATDWLHNPEYRGKWVYMTPECYEAIFDEFDLEVPDIPAAGVYLLGSKLQ